MLKLNLNGDTIVEVLVALAVLSLAFAISYSTASRALTLSQNTQEHSTALGILDKQMEMIWYAYQPINNGTPIQTNIENSQYFCLNDQVAAAQNKVNVQFTSIPNSSLNLPLMPNKIPNITKCLFTSGASFNYTVIDYRSNHTFTASIWWNGLSSLGVQHEQLSYKAYPNE